MTTDESEIIEPEMIAGNPETRAVKSESALSDLLCVISPHEKGFWQADVYESGCDEDGVSPVWFATGKKGDDRYSVISKASEAYPGIRFIAGVTGRCPDCSEDYFEMETHCECGSILNEP